ncbi:hypothetical protein HMPREF3293_01926 [Christensenella minuta]|uniref:Uncharacterized protein n=1 Tax=Christensenella minuta TaxID=626937 RepID=A0A136Q478_9FIRM|nr:hypothetical protein HMPREF3293_01926 [Christensenella minuta]
MSVVDRNTDHLAGNRISKVLIRRAPVRFLVLRKTRLKNKKTVYIRREICYNI